MRNRVNPLGGGGGGPYPKLLGVLNIYRLSARPIIIMLYDGQSPTIMCHHNAF